MVSTLPYSKYLTIPTYVDLVEVLETGKGTLKSSYNKKWNKKFRFISSSRNWKKGPLIDAFLS